MTQTEAKSYFQYLGLFFMCFLSFGSYFCYDLPGALQDNFERDLNLKITEVTFLYSVYSWPNVVFCFVGGYLLDKIFGTRFGTNMYLLLTLIGQLMFAAGGYLDVYKLMLAGRFVFGIGSESAAIAQNNYAVRWFKGRELNMVFGLILSFARIGSTVTFLVTEPLYKWVDKYYQGRQCIGIVLFIASSACLFSLICSLILGIMDEHRERSQLVNDDDDGNNVPKKSEIIKLSDIKQFPVYFWLIAIICVAYYIAIFPFISISKAFFMNVFHYTAVDANHLSSIQYLVATVSSPIFGILVDKVGLNLIWIFSAIIYTIAAHSILTFTSCNPVVGMVILGLSYSLLASSLWPLVALIVPEYQLGTAYGICQAIQNLGLAVFVNVVGAIAEKKGYIYTEVVFQSTLYITLIVCTIMWILNSINKGNLNLTKNERREYEQQWSQQLLPACFSPVLMHILIIIENRFRDQIAAENRNEKTNDLFDVDSSNNSGSPSITNTA